MEGVRLNINSRLCKLDHLHLTFGRVQAALTDLATETQMVWDDSVFIRNTGRALQHSLRNPVSDSNER